MKTYLLGGMVKPVTEAVVGEDAIASLERLHFTLGFWGTNGISLSAGFTTPELSEAKVKEVSIAHTQSPYVLADATKFDQVSSSRLQRSTRLPSSRTISIPGVPIAMRRTLWT